MNNHWVKQSSDLQSYEGQTSARFADNSSPWKVEKGGIMLPENKEISEESCNSDLHR